MNELAVLMTCFNRKNKTIKCLKSLYRLFPSADVFMVDDGSTDGTEKEVKDLFPRIHIIRGTGNLYWSRGMHCAWESARKGDYDFYLWLNDDVALFDNCFDELFSCSNLESNKSIIVGIVVSENREEVLYGGTNAEHVILEPNGFMRDVCNMNGNVVLVPDSVFKKIGNINPVYHHDLGDVDYGYCARSNGVAVKTTRVPVASGEKNDICRVRRVGVNLVQRFKRLYSPLGNPPFINFYFRNKYYGFFNAVGYFLYLHLINLAPDVVIYKFFGDRYR